MDEKKNPLDINPHSGIPSLKERIKGAFIAIPVVCIFIYLRFGMMWTVTAAFFFTIMFAVSFFFEYRSYKKDDELRNAVVSGEYYADEKWREKYAEYREKHDFQQVKGNSMKADLAKYYVSKFGIGILVFAVILFICMFIFRDGSQEIAVGFGGGGLLFGTWGASKLYFTPVRKFVKDCGDRYEMIERSYLNGKKLTYKRNGEKAYRNGINIGGGYTVIFDMDNIHAVDNNEIADVSRFVTKTKNYGDGLYLGASYTYTLRIETAQNYVYRVVMNEFQVEMAYDELRRESTSAELVSAVRHDIG